MKARVKATGEIVEIYSFVDTDQNEWVDCYLEFLEPIVSDYWTRLEHQYAGMAMQGILSNPESELDYGGDGTLPQALAGCAAKVAHALVEKLKEEK